VTAVARGLEPGRTARARRAAPASRDRSRAARRCLVLGVITLALGLARPAIGHPLDLGYLRIDADGRALTVAFDLHVNAAAQLLATPPVALDAVGLARRADALADATVRRAPIVTPAGPCRWTTATATRSGSTASVVAHATCPTGIRALRWSLPLVGEARVGPTFQILARLRLAGGELVAIADQARPELAVSAAGAIGVAAFVWTGVEHIGAAPGQWHDADGPKLPDGLDHILFLLALMLAGGRLVPLLGIVSGFTLGHSITLALSALDVVRPPAALIEPLIALSIALVAGEALIGRPGRTRWKLASGFGLIHGFGFASALNQLELPTGELVGALFGYNLGVELGQIAIVVAAAPLVLALQRHPRFHWIVRGMAAAILVAGVSWFFQRL
jgi:hypothetical protein